MACIAIDCRFASLPVGIGTYTRSLIPRLIEHLSGHHIVLLVRGNERWQKDLPNHVTYVTIRAKHYSLLEHFEIPFRLKQVSADLFFCPHFNVPFRCPCPFVTTVHDLILHTYPNQASFHKIFAYRKLMKYAVTHARKIIAVSSFTARSVEKEYGCGNRLSIVHEGVDKEFSRPSEDACARTLAKYKLQPGYFLYVGGSKEHKNVQLLIDVHAHLNRGTQLVLVTCGKESRELELRGNVKLICDVGYRELMALYGKARCFVTVSKYEGFCLPVLEARACGCPVIASNVTAIPEVAGPNTVLIPPTRDELRTALKIPPTQSDPVDPKYNWEDAASKTADILLSAL